MIAVLPELLWFRRTLCHTSYEPSFCVTPGCEPQTNQLVYNGLSFLKGIFKFQLLFCVTVGTIISNCGMLQCLTSSKDMEAYSINDF